MIRKILDNKLILIVIVSVMTIFSVFILQFANSQNASPESTNFGTVQEEFKIENFKTEFFGKYIEGGTEQQISLIIKTLTEYEKGEYTFSYDLKLDFVLVVENKTGTIFYDSKTLIFKTDNLTPKEQEIINKLGESNFEISAINKIKIIGKRWQVSEM